MSALQSRLANQREIGRAIRIRSRSSGRAAPVVFVSLCLLVLVAHRWSLSAPSPSASSDRFDRFDRFDPHPFVDPFIGTAGTGHTFPGAVLPFSRTQPSPDNGNSSWGFTSGYHASSSTLYGFSNTHLSGTGIHDLMNVTMAPVALGAGWFERLVRGSAFESAELRKTHPGSFEVGEFDEMMRRRKVEGSEVATAGYYRVDLVDDGGRTFGVELTVDEGAAWHRYSLGKPSKENVEYAVVVDISKVHQEWGKVVGGFINVVSPTVLEGKRVTSVWAMSRAVYFRVEFSLPYTEAVVVRGDEEALMREGGSRAWTGATSGGQCLADTGGCAVAFLKYAARDIDGLVARVGISYTGLAGAAAALEARESSSRFGFDSARADAGDVWRHALSKIRVEGGDERARRIFYTALYHASIHPTVHMDVEDGGTRLFMGPDHEVHDLLEMGDDVADLGMKSFYTTLSLWDIFRAQYPLLTLIHPDVAKDVALSTIAHASLSPTGVLPVWPLAGVETWEMPGYHATSIIAEAIAKGLIDEQATIERALHHAVVSAKFHTRGYFDLGFMPWNSTDDDSGSASTTLEHAFDDHCIAEIAKAAGNETQERLFRRRSVHGYRAIFDSGTGFFRAKNEDGSWVERAGEAFDPDFSQHRGGAFTEGTAHLWRWFVPHDPDGLADVLGGKQRAEELLTEFFFPTGPVSIRGGRKGSLSDLTGALGHYAHGNEPAHHAPFLFNAFGRPRKTQYLVRKILKELYDDRPDGIRGNDDCGQMSAWYVLASIGLYPINPSSATYQITTPLWTRAEIDVGAGKFVIDAPGASDAPTMYIRRAELFDVDGRSRGVLDRLAIEHQDIVAGGRLMLELEKGRDDFW